MDRVGPRYIYQRLIESGAFNGLAATPAQSVRLVAFEDAIAEISNQNALT